MAGVKDVGGAKGAVGTVLPKEIKEDRPSGDVVRQAVREAGVAGQAARMEAGQAVISQAARRAAEERERLEEDRTEKEQSSQEEKEYRDTPELSRQSRWFGVEGKLLAQASRRWVLEMEEEAWEALLNWQPGQGGDIRRALAELSRLYLALLEAILTYTTGDEQKVQQGRLDAVLAQKLSLIWDMNIKDLENFFIHGGQDAVLKAIKASLYRQVTGGSVSPRAAQQFYAKGKGSGTDGRSGSAGGAVRESGGSVYARTAGGNIRVGAASFGRGDSGEKQIRQRWEVVNSYRESGGKTVGVAYGRGGQAGAFRGSELTTANAFARHMNGSGNLFRDSAFSARNDEAAGIFAAAAAVKGQVYVEAMARDSALRAPVRNAVDKFVDYYLSRKGVYKVYAYTTHAYERTKSPQKAMEEGLAYAYQIFAEKKGDAAYAKQEAYGERAGFFQAVLKSLTLEEDLKRGMRLLEMNWLDFLRAIDQEDNKKLTLKLQNYSPWGALLKGAKKGKAAREEPPTEKKGRRLLATELFGLALAVIAWLFYMLFLR